jgi:hypothetical protein
MRAREVGSGVAVATGTNVNSPQLRSALDSQVKGRLALPFVKSPYSNIKKGGVLLIVSRVAIHVYVSPGGKPLGIITDSLRPNKVTDIVVGDGNVASVAVGRRHGPVRHPVVLKTGVNVSA